MGNGKVLRDFYKTRTEAQVTETLLNFTRRQVHILVSAHHFILSLLIILVSKTHTEMNFFELTSRNNFAFWPSYFPNK